MEEHVSASGSHDQVLPRQLVTQLDQKGQPWLHSQALARRANFAMIFSKTIARETNICCRQYCGPGDDVHRRGGGEVAKRLTEGLEVFDGHKLGLSS